MWFIERRSLPYFTMSNSRHAQIVDSSFIAGVRKPAQSRTIVGLSIGNLAHTSGQEVW